MVKKHKFQVVLPTDAIEVTNPNLDEEYVESLRVGIINGKINPRDLDPILVRIIKGEGYFDHDGNHRLEAMKRAGVREVRAEVWPMVRRKPESL
jgi:uncharacterized ParB-like nuclease family protein